MGHELRPTRSRRWGEHRALAVAALLAFGALVWIALPLWNGLFIGLMVAFTMRPPYEALARRWRRPSVAAVACCALATLAALGGVGTVVELILTGGGAIAKMLPQALATGSGVYALVAKAARPLGVFGVTPNDLMGHLRHAGEAVAFQLARLAPSAVGIGLDLLVAAIFMLLVLYVVLCNWGRLAHLLVVLSPLRPATTRRLVTDARSIGRRVMLGTLFVGLVQGLLAGVGYAIAGVPQPWFFGALTAVASVLPALGTLFVWLPVGLYLVTTNRVGAGIYELAWGVLVVVAACDGVLRPKLVGKGAEMGLVPTLVGLFGGLKLFGFMGFLIGPMLVGVVLSILRLYREDRREAHIGEGFALPGGPQPGPAALQDRALQRERVHVPPREAASTESETVGEIGRLRWAIAEGYIPAYGNGIEPEMASDETVCMLNANGRDAHVAITLYFTDRGPAGPYAAIVPAQRTLHLRFSDLHDPEPVPRATDYASLIESDVPIVVQHTRLDTRQSESALMTTMAFPLDG